MAEERALKATMTPELWQRLRPLYDAALEIPEAKRAQFVNQACGSDSELGKELAALLEASAGTTGGDHIPIFSFKDLFLPRSKPFSIGELVLGRFEIVRHLGTGGMGEVYEAMDLELGRIALKTIRPEVAENPETLARFRKEVQLARKISGPHVCRIHELFVIPASPREPQKVFLTMEYLGGSTLADKIAIAAPFPWPEARLIALQICDGLQTIHEAGIIHRDLKPRNIMLAPRNGSTCAVLMDFGLAREFTKPNSANPTASALSGAIVGTPDYMAPEQFAGKELSPATDVYSLGIVLYELVTGKHPFAAPTPIAAAVLRGKPPCLASSIQPRLSRRCDEVICKCLEYDPRRRYQSANDAAEDLSNGSFFLMKLRSQIARFSRRKILAAAILASICVALTLTFVRFPMGLHVRKEVTIPFAERDWILVTDFTNQTGENVFDGVVRDLVTQSLSQSSYLNVVQRLTAMDAAKRTGLKDLKLIDSNLGRELCLRENYTAMVTGEILKSGSKYILTLRVLLPEKEAPVVSESESFQTPNEIYTSVDRLVFRLRRALGESLTRLEKKNRPLAQVTTPSIEALQRYSAAFDLYGAREYVRCIALAKDAIELDANFSMAHLLMARAYEQIGDEMNSRAQFQKARAGINQVGEREKHLILAADYSSQGMNEKAAEEYQHLLDIYPDDIDSLKGFAESAFWAGRPDQAVASQRRALTFSPNDVGCYDTLMTLLIRTNKFSEAVAVYKQARSRKIETTNLSFLAALAAWGNEDLGSARRMLDSLDDGTNDYWRVVSKLYVGKLLGYQGHMRDAAAAFRSGLSLVERPGWENWVPVFQYQLAKAEMTIGGGAVAGIECRKFGRIARETPIPGNLHRAGRLYIALHDLESARQVEALLKQQVALHPDPFSEMEFYGLLGDIDLATGRPESAVQNQERALAFLKGFEPYLSLGEACEESRDWKCAIDSYTHFLQLKGEILRDDVGADWVIAHHSLARIYLRSGNSALALALNQQFTNHFASADLDLPVLTDSQHLSTLLGQAKP